MNVQEIYLGVFDAPSSAADADASTLREEAPLCAHDGAVTDVSVVSSLDACATSSTDGTVAVQSMRGTDLRRVLSHPQRAPLHRAVLGTGGQVVAHSWRDSDLLLFAPQGSLAARVPAGERLTSLAITRDEGMLVTGGEAGVLRMWRAHALQEVAAVNLRLHGPIRSLALSGNDDVVAIGVRAVTLNPPLPRAALQRVAYSRHVPQMEDGALLAVDSAGQALA